MTGTRFSRRPPEPEFPPAPTLEEYHLTPEDVARARAGAAAIEDARIRLHREAQYVAVVCGSLVLALSAMLGAEAALGIFLAFAIYGCVLGAGEYRINGWARQERTKSHPSALEAFDRATGEWQLLCKDMVARPWNY